MNLHHRHNSVCYGSSRRGRAIPTFRQSRLQRVYQTWQVMEEVLLTDDATEEREPDMSVYEQWYSRFKDYPTPGCNKVIRVEKYWQDVYRIAIP